jgi:hypothetical protein
VTSDGPQDKSASRILRSRGCCGSAFGSPAIVADIGFRPVALRLRLSPDLPLSSGTTYSIVFRGGSGAFTGKNQAGQGRRRSLRKNADSTIGAQGRQSTGPLVLSRRNLSVSSFKDRSGANNPSQRPSPRAAPMTPSISMYNPSSRRRGPGAQPGRSDGMILAAIPC